MSESFVACLIYFYSIGIPPVSPIISICNGELLRQKDCKEFVCKDLKQEDWKNARRNFPECMCLLQNVPKS